MNITPSLRIGIIGGTGRTGSQFARLFSEQGFPVEVTGRKTRARNAELFRTCDIIIFAVPLAESVSIIEEAIVHATREDQLLLDVSSLKQKQVAALQKGAGEVVGMHPLFGPWTEVHGETVILCPARAADTTVQSLEELLHSMGLKTKRMSAEEHDKLMALLQVLPHVKNFLVADVLQRIDADVSKILETCTPPYELELNVVGRFLDDNPALYGPIILNNPDTLSILEAFNAALSDCIAMAKKQDLKRFSERYEQLRSFFGAHAKEGRESTEACIRFLSSQQS
ncbi:MAG: prephenate dehydrogenase/arogenate dehydrogenase family protein [Candidatus Peribacteraceae bacterium]|jgi:prephenate dehydrogenase